MNQKWRIGVSPSVTAFKEVLPEQSCFAFQLLSQLQVPSLQTPLELQSSSIKQTYAKEIQRINLNKWKIFIQICM